MPPKKRGPEEDARQQDGPKKGDAKAPPLDLRAARYAVFRRPSSSEDKEGGKHPGEKSERKSERGQEDAKVRPNHKGKAHKWEDKSNEVKVPTATSKKMCRPEQKGNHSPKQGWKTWNWWGKRDDQAQKETQHQEWVKNLPRPLRSSKTERTGSSYDVHKPKAPWKAPDPSSVNLPPMDSWKPGSPREMGKGKDKDKILPKAQAKEVQKYQPVKKTKKNKGRKKKRAREWRHYRPEPRIKYEEREKTKVPITKRDKANENQEKEEQKEKEKQGKGEQPSDEALEESEKDKGKSEKENPTNQVLLATAEEKPEEGEKEESNSSEEIGPDPPIRDTLVFMGPKTKEESFHLDLLTKESPDMDAEEEDELEIDLALEMDFPTDEEEGERMEDNEKGRLTDEPEPEGDS